ncbi:sugar transporter [Aestuariibius sp. HNIBRBA575]|uniref:sugar transporter n=1 Tax=Aestuariibius sp. HNIBRBA575 TaxID=3233343 RepID=UPI0034A50504
MEDKASQVEGARPQSEAPLTEQQKRERQIARVQARAEGREEEWLAQNPPPAPPKPAPQPASVVAGVPTQAEVEAAAPPAQPAFGRRRHFRQVMFFLQLVILPCLISGWYLFFVAQDQYASHVGFSVRKEETSSAIEILGGITELSGSSANDTTILFEFIQSQNMVRAVSDKLDLRAAYHRPGDPIFSLPDDQRIEALTNYWHRMVDVFFDRSSGLIEIRVRAFTPEDSHAIAVAIFEESNRTINALSAIARDDTTRYAREELDHAIERLKQARTAVTEFRIRTQVVDPAADIQGRMGLVNTLQAQLAEAVIDLDLLRQSSRDDDPRVIQAQRRVAVIQDRISAERSRFSESATASEEDLAYSRIVSEYEALAVDQKFAEEAYVGALASFDAATAAAQRQSRYLATYIEPTLPETPLYPRRWVLLATIFGALFTGWSILTMIYYSLRDRR